MPDTTFYIIFGVTWVFAMAYGFSAVRLLLRLRALRADGRAMEAPNPLVSSLDIFRYLAWLMTGRYQELNDVIVTRWSSIARILLIIAAPMILAMFALAISMGVV